MQPLQQAEAVDGVAGMQIGKARCCARNRSSPYGEIQAGPDRGATSVSNQVKFMPEQGVFPSKLR
jgi:hypothetical protein